MKRFFYLLLAVAMLASFGCSGDTNISAKAEGTDTISGVLRDPATNAPIVGAVIKNGNATCTTDAQGMWTLGGFTIPTALNDTNNLTFIVSVVPPTGKGYPTQAFRTVIGSGNGINNLTLGKTNATVRGVISNANGTPAVGATVYLLYATDSDNFGNLVTSAGTVYTLNKTKEDTTDANGEFTITEVETGASVIVIAKSADGTRSGMWPTQVNNAGVANNPFKLANTDNFVNNLNAQWGAGNAVVANGNQPFRFAATTDINLPSVVVAPTMTLDGNPVNSINNGEFAPGKVVLTYTFSKPIAVNSYMDSANFTNDMFINAANKDKGVNIPVLVELDKADKLLKGVKISFNTGDSQIYTVDLGGIGNSTGKIQDKSFLNKLGFAVNADSAAVVFSTTSKLVAKDAPKLEVAQSKTGTDYKKNCTVTWKPVTNAAGYRVFVKKNYSGTSTEYIELVKTTATEVNLQEEIDKQVAPSPLVNNNFGGSIFFEGANKITYDVKVFAVDKSGALNESLASQPVNVADTTSPSATGPADADRKWDAHTFTKEYENTKQEIETQSWYLFGKSKDKPAYKKATIKFTNFGALPDQMVDNFKASLGIVPPAKRYCGLSATSVTPDVKTKLESADVDFKIEVKSGSESYDSKTQTLSFEYDILVTLDIPPYLVDANGDKFDEKGMKYAISQDNIYYLFTLKDAKDLNGNALVYGKDKQGI